LDAGKALAKKFGCDNVLTSILDFNPAIDFVGMKPVTKRIPRTKTTPTEMTIDENDGTITPIRSRAPSTTTILGTPVRDHHTQQEATPNHKTLPPFGLSKRLFDEENTQRDFFETLYSRKKTKAEDTSNLENLDYQLFENVQDSLTEKRHAILMHLFIQEDSDYSTALFFELIKLKSNPTKIDLEFVLDEEGGSLIHWAAACGRVGLVKLLISHGAKVTDICGRGVTPLMKALESIGNFSLNTMDALLKLLGPSVFIADKEGRTALHYACILSRFRSKREVSTYYMECIASYLEDTRFSSNSPLINFVDAADTNGDTALHISCRYKNHKNVALLVNLNASNEIENAAKETAMTLSIYDFRLQQLMVFIY
jgi:ankyrin repeat protein